VSTSCESKPNLLIIVPAHHEADIGRFVVGEIRGHVPDPEVAVLDNGSSLRFDVVKRVNVSS